MYKEFKLLNVEKPHILGVTTENLKIVTLIFYL